MGSPLGPLLANVFMGSIGEILERESKIPSFCKRYVDETTIMSDTTSATYFLNGEQWCASLSWYAATEQSDSNRAKVYVKPTKRGDMLHYQTRAVLIRAISEGF